MLNCIFNTLTWPWFNQFDRLDNYDQLKWVKAFKRDQSTGDVEHKFDEDGRRINIHRYYCINERTEELFVPDPVSVVAMKCYILLFLNPLHVAGTIFYNTAKIPVDIVGVFFAATYAFVQTLRERENLLGSWYEIIKGSVIDLTSSLVYDVWSVPRALWYGLGYELACLEGVISDPFRARVKIGTIERQWNHGYSRMWTLEAQCPERAGNRTVSEALEILSRVKTFYLAHCMQRQGKVSDLIEVDGEQLGRFELLDRGNSYLELRRRDYPQFVIEDPVCCPLTRPCVA